MSLKVLCFATIREKIGEPALVLDPPIPSNVHQLILKIKEKYPEAAPHLEIARVAVNQEFVDISHPLSDGDEVAIIPPVSGG